MKAIVQDAYGSADVLGLRDVDVPAPGDDDVLVRVHAAGVDPGVWHLMTGRPYLTRAWASGCARPRSGSAAGTWPGVVEAVGAGRDPVPAGRRGVRHLRADRSPSTRVATEDRLALEAGEPELRAGRGRADLGRHRPAGAPRRRQGPAGQRGAGHRRGRRRRLVRRAARQGVRGARSPGCAAPAKADLVRSLGADDVIDYTREDFARRAGSSTSSSTPRATGRSPSLRRALTPTRHARHRRRGGRRAADGRISDAQLGAGLLVRVCRPAAQGRHVRRAGGGPRGS